MSDDVWIRQSEQEKARYLAFALNILCQIFLLKFVSSNGLLGDKCVSSIQGVALLQHTYKSFVVRDMFACYYSCKDDDLCQSLNFYRDNNLCELNNRTRSVRLSNSMSHPNAFHMDNPFRALLGSFPVLPAESCEEIKKGSEGLAPNGLYWINIGRPGNQPVSAYCDMELGVIVYCTGNPCQNGGTCEYQGNGQFTCHCVAGYNGSHCEHDIDDCAANPCLNGGTCTDMVNGFHCTCAALFAGMRCEFQVGPECSAYSIISEPDRSVQHRSTSSSIICDRNEPLQGWYRFNGTAGSTIPTDCVPKHMCNTHAPGWLNGTHPTPQEGAVNRTVCFHWSSKCCNWKQTISVTNCVTFYVYKLAPTTYCYLRFCVTN